MDAEPRQRRAWLAASLVAVGLAHAPALAGGLLDADRLLLVRNPEMRTFAGAAAMLSAGAPVLRAAGLVVTDHSPAFVLSTWLGWQWFRAHPLMQHAASLALLLAVVAALTSLLAALRLAPALACAAALALALHPSAADLSAPLLGRGALLAVAVTLIAARRAREAGPPAAAAWAGFASLFAGLCAPGWGLLGLVAAQLPSAPRVRRAASLSALGAAAVTLALTRADLGASSADDALAAAGEATFLAWLPSLEPLVVTTAGGAAIFAAIPVVALAALAWFGAARLPGEPHAALVRAGAAAMSASLVAGAATWREGTVTGAPAFALHLGLVLALAGLAAARVPPAKVRPALLLVFVVPALLVALRVRAFAEEDQVLSAIAARDADDPEALLARARLALRHGSLEEAAPWCLRYGKARPSSFRADGCVAAIAAARGDEQVAVALLQRWAGRFPSPRALRAAVLEIAGAQPDPRFAEAFQRATGFALPARRTGEP